MILWKKATVLEKSQKAPKVQANAATQQSNTISGIRTKKRKRDKTAGLRMTTNVTQPKCAPKPIPVARVPASAAKKSIKSKTLNPSKSKESTKKRPTLKMVAPPQAISQKKNALLSLANALKMKSSSNQNSDRNKLEKLLK